MDIIKTICNMYKLFKQIKDIRVSDNNLVIELEKNIVITTKGSYLVHTEDGYIISSAKKTYINPPIKDYYNNIIPESKTNMLLLNNYVDKSIILLNRRMKKQKELQEAYKLMEQYKREHK